jgi:hypothetical protein
LDVFLPPIAAAGTWRNGRYALAATYSGTGKTQDR